MPTSNDLNYRIALKKGWTYKDVVLHIGGPFVARRWADPEGKPVRPPDFVGTLEGMSGMLWELGPEWTLHPDPPDGWLIWRDELVGGICQVFCSPKDKLGDCVGDAWTWMSEHGKEAADDSTD